MKRTGPLSSGLAALATVSAAAIVLSRGAPAEAAWDWARHCFKKADIDVLHGVIAQMLKDAPAGSRQPWCSTTGRQGFVYLVSGGEKAGSDTAVVRITKVDAKAERTWFVFHYRKVPSRGWGIVG